MPEKAPAFQFYPKDFLTDSKVVKMNLTELGAYVVLLCRCWLDGSLPNDINELADLCRVKAKEFARLWPKLQPCFVEKDGALVQPRIERERVKQQEYRDMKAAAGRQGGRPKAEGKQKEAEAKQNESTQPAPAKAHESSSSAICYLPSASSSADSSLARRSRGQPPLAMNLRRLKIWRWMIEEFIDRLGNYAEEFDLDAWIRSRDEQETRVIQGDDWWEYWRSAFEAEVRRRALPIATAPQLGKTTTRLATALANIKAAEQA